MEHSCCTHGLEAEQIVSDRKALRIGDGDLESLISEVGKCRAKIQSCSRRPFAVASEFQKGRTVNFGRQHQALKAEQPSKVVYPDDYLETPM